MNRILLGKFLFCQIQNLNLGNRCSLCRRGELNPVFDTGKLLCTKCKHCLIILCVIHCVKVSCIDILTLANSFVVGMAPDSFPGCNNLHLGYICMSSGAVIVLSI